MSSNKLLDDLVQERANLLMQMEQINILMKDEIAKVYMKMGVGRMSSLVDPKTGKHTMEVEQCTLEEAKERMAVRLQENSNEIQSTVQSMHR